MGSGWVGGRTYPQGTREFFQEPSYCVILIVGLAGGHVGELKRREGGWVGGWVS